MKIYILLLLYFSPFIKKSPPIIAGTAILTNHSSIDAAKAKVYFSVKNWLKKIITEPRIPNSNKVIEGINVETKYVAEIIKTDNLNDKPTSKKTNNKKNCITKTRYLIALISITR
ncbi:MAG: hypothetical protein ABIJ97_14860, partial [Bacteroidota bacterium]